MGNLELLIKEVKEAPTPIIDEVLDFVRFLKSKMKHKNLSDEALISEQALAKDWLRPEEDSAWEHL